MLVGQPVRRGTAIFVHKRITYIPQSVPTVNVENTTMHIKTSTSELRLVAAYKRPSNQLLTSEIDSLLNTPAQTIIASDLNSKHRLWNNRNNNQSGEIEMCTLKYTPTETQNPLPHRILQEISYKGHFCTQWQRFRDLHIKSTFNRQTSRVKDLLSEHRSSQSENLLGSLNDRAEGLNRFFKHNKSLLRKSPPSHPLQDSAGN